jgi:two-component system, OmpR family, alkaline phosphatase synthesis response regulator PhoP
MSQILVVEDEAHIAEGLRFNLEAEGHSVELTDNGEDALRKLQVGGQPFEAVVLDVMLPGKDGFTVVRELRQAKNYIPVLILTARGRPEDVLTGFEAGADDYLPKPFNLDILIARIESLLRRKQWLGAGDPAAAASTALDPSRTFRFGDKLVDFEHLRLHVGEKSFQLTLMEADLLRFLIANVGHPVSRKAILEKVWNLHEDTDTRAIDNFIVRLRRYIESDPSNPRHLLTVRGIGYELVVDSDS